MRKRWIMITALPSTCIAAGFLCGAAFLTASAAGGDTSRGAIVEHRDLHLAPEALSAAEGLPYEFMVPEKNLVKTRIDPRDIYLDLEAVHAAEGLPYRYQMDRGDYLPVKHAPQDLELDIEKMLSDDPSFIRGQSNY